MEKKKVIEQLVAYLEEELAAGERPEEIRQLLLMYRFLPVRPFGAEDVACPAALVELEYNGSRAFYYIAPRGGGLVTRVEGEPVQVVTPQSPIGAAILGKKAGDWAEVSMRDSTKRRYRVISVS